MNESCLHLKNSYFRVAVRKNGHGNKTKKKKNPWKKTKLNNTPQKTIEIKIINNFAKNTNMTTFPIFKLKISFGEWGEWSNKSTFNGINLIKTNSALNFIFYILSNNTLHNIFKNEYRSEYKAYFKVSDTKISLKNKLLRKLLLRTLIQLKLLLRVVLLRLGSITSSSSSLCKKIKIIIVKMLCLLIKLLLTSTDMSNINKNTHYFRFISSTGLNVIFLSSGFSGK
ncbi:hypothetical protein AGLY_006676 [Aphis glycines]|uniref:Uncharacterized protein n=1 Tax=Aphis glycines TaxID=307491 RepID=A0A6G0TRX7_APHGL|nr:hypothetical protein AGLY_006676 [Aphis glycines]